MLVKLNQKRRSSLNVLTIAGVKPYQEKLNEEYMSFNQRLHFRKILEAWYNQLKSDINFTKFHMRDKASINFPDPIDRASQEEEFNIALRNRDREHKLLRKIEKTLEKIKMNRFGFCLLCDVEIGIRRLEAWPTADLCIDCKTLAEIKEKQMTGIMILQVATRAWIGIGSNLFNPESQVDMAIRSLSCIPKTKFVACSSYYFSRPLLNLKNQPNFLNTVVVLDTFLSAKQLLSYMQFIENQQGRVRKKLIRWCSRTLDLDILLFGSFTINTTDLIVPHYDMMRREFIIYPLFELDSNLIFPDGKTIKDVLQILPKNDLCFWKKKNK